MGVLIMYRVKKADGWNKYKIQRRFLLFWFRVDGNTYNSRAEADYWCNQMNCLAELEKLI